MGMNLNPLAALVAAQMRVKEEKAKLNKHKLANAKQLEIARVRKCDYFIANTDGKSIAVCKLNVEHEGGHDLEIIPVSERLRGLTISFNYQ